MELVSSAENSSLDWKAQYTYIEDIGDGRGYTAGIIGFCSGTGDMLELVEEYTERKPGNVLAKYLPGAARGRTAPTRTPASDPTFAARLAQGRHGPGVPAGAGRRARPGLLQPGGQPGQGRRPARARPVRLLRRHRHARRRRHAASAIRKRAMTKAKTPAQGGDETTYLNAFLDARVVEMKKEEAHVGHQPRRHRAARLPRERQPRPGPAAELEGLRRPVLEELLGGATPAAAAPDERRLRPTSRSMVSTRDRAEVAEDAQRAVERDQSAGRARGRARRRRCR